MRFNSTTPRPCQQCGTLFIGNVTRIYCGDDCSRIGFRAKKAIPLKDRFWDKVDKSPSETDPDACWPWIGALDSDGYGMIGAGPNSKKDHLRAPRVAYELTYGPMPEGTFACHRCDNPPCCRPDHLFAGSIQENTADMVKKGRQAKGEAAHSACLTADEVRYIRTVYAAGGVSQTDLARLYGIGQTSISKIISRRTWKHIE